MLSRRGRCRPGGSAARALRSLVHEADQPGLEFSGFSPDDLRSIQVPVLITLGDRDVVRPEHAVEMYRHIPRSQLAIFPGADHFLLWQNPEQLLPTVADFLEEPAVAGASERGR